MLLSSRSQIYLTTTLLLLAITFYVSIYFGTISQALLSTHFDLGGESSAYQPPNLALVLHPEDHVYRQPETIRYVWNITSGFRSPDGVKKRVYLINGAYENLLVRRVDVDRSKDISRVL